MADLAHPNGREILALRDAGRHDEADALLPALHARCAAILQEPQALSMLMDRMADHLTHGHQNTRRVNQVERAARYLDRVLPHGPWRRDAIIAEAAHQGIRLHALYRAARNRVTATRHNRTVWWGTA